MTSYLLSWLLSWLPKLDLKGKNFAFPGANSSLWYLTNSEKVIVKNIGTFHTFCKNVEEAGKKVVELLP